jgi:hypothetical protein
MAAVAYRRALAFVSVIGLVGMPLLPPEHVHVTEDEGHHTEFIHRHFESHHPLESQPFFDHQDEQAALWLDTPFIGTETAHAPSADRVLEHELPILQPRPIPRWTLTFDHISVHDPPWAASIGLRAPPTLLV